MLQRKEQIAFDAHPDEINELAGSMVGCLINPDQPLYFTERQIRHRGAKEFKKVYSLYQIQDSFQQSTGEVLQLIQSDSIVDIEVRERDCLISYNPTYIKDQIIKWPDLWNQFILTRTYFGRRN